MSVAITSARRQTRSTKRRTLFSDLRSLRHSFPIFLIAAPRAPPSRVKSRSTHLRVTASLQTRAFNWRPNHRTPSAPRRGSKEAIEMAYIFRGRLCGYICEECWKPISRVKVRLYRVREDQNTIARAVASPKDTFSILDEAQVREKESILIAYAD